MCVCVLHVKGLFLSACSLHNQTFIPHCVASASSAQLPCCKYINRSPSCECVFKFVRPAVTLRRCSFRCLWHFDSSRLEKQKRDGFLLTIAHDLSDLNPDSDPACSAKCRLIDIVRSEKMCIVMTLLKAKALKKNCLTRHPAKEATKKKNKWKPAQLSSYASRPDTWRAPARSLKMLYSSSSESLAACVNTASNKKPLAQISDELEHLAAD